MAKTNAVIIKKVKKGGHGHHGGAWKVAYADFVTAMMAFFLLLWLLNATTDAQKRGIADYFSPTLATTSHSSGAGGVLGGRTMSPDGSNVSNAAPPTVSFDLNAPPAGEDSDETDGKGRIPDPGDGQPKGQDTKDDDENHPRPGQAEGVPLDSPTLTSQDKADLQKIGANPAQFDKLSEKQFEQLKAMREERQFEKVEYELKQAIQSLPDLKELAQNLVVDRTADGLRIQLVDQDKNAMFPLGSSDPDAAAKKLMSAVSRVIDKLPNKLSISGHTDATPFHGNNYDNYDLSVDRARAMRHALIANGTPEDRIESVQGKGSTDPIEPNNPTAAINRRVSIVLLRTYGAGGSTDGAAAKADTATTSPAPTATP